MLRSESSQTPGDDGHGAEPCPGCIDNVWAAGVLLAVPIVPIPTLEVVLCAGYRDLHGFSDLGCSLAHRSLLLEAARDQ